MARLGRQHRVTVVQRKALNSSSENELRKQRIQLEKLQKDNDTFKEQLRLAEMDFKAEQGTGDKVRELRARYAGYEAEIEAELERGSELDVEIAEATAILEQERTSLGKSQSLIRSPESYQRQIATMENRLENSLNGYDVQLAKNARLRETIDHLKKERSSFGGLKRRIETDLLEQKKQIGEIIDSSNQAYEARDDAQARMSALRERSEKELQESTMELKELNRVLEQERKLKEFMGVKGRDRAKDLNDAAKARKDKGEAKERPEVVINQYEAVFTQLKEVCGIEDTSELTDRFIETEDRNFSLFNLVNELNTNIESLKEQITRVEQQITEYDKQSEEMDKERTQKFKQLEVQLSRAEASASKFNELATERRAELGKLVVGITSFVDKVGCDRGPISEMLGEKDVNERNIMQFLGVIEQRANELLLMQARLDYKAQTKWEAAADRLINEHAVDAIGSYDPTVDLGEKPVVHGVLGAGPKIKAVTGDLGAPKLMIGDGDYDDDDDEDDEELLRPLTHSELKAKIIRGQRAKAHSAAETKERRGSTKGP
jgi:chromosome segregation ATPase